MAYPADVIRTALVVSCVMLLAACSSRDHTDDVRVCDAAGCSVRAASSVSADYVDRSAPASAEILALQSLAETEPKAAYDLALRYFRGDGVAMNSYQALQWMRKAATAGDLNAQAALGRLYLTGLGEMGPDGQEAQRWLSLAASSGDQEAAQLLEQAQALRNSEQAYYRWQKQWRESVRSYWHHGYPYYGVWRDSSWYY